MGSSEGTDHLTTEELFRQHAGFVARFLTRLGVPAGQLEDTLQEVFLVVHRNGGYRPGIAKPTSYLANIAIRAAAQHRRRAGVARTRHSEAPPDQMPGEVEDPARALQARQDLRRLQDALARLPEDLCTTLVLVELEGESCVSVAAGLGCPVGTIYWRLHQARKELQSALRAVDGQRRSPQAAPEPGRRLQPTRSFMGIFGFDAFNRSEASRLLQRAREQPSQGVALDAWLARHQQLVQAGSQLPAWANGFAPHAPSLVTLVGAGPIVASVTAGGAILAAVLFTTYGSPSSVPDERARERSTAAAPQVGPVAIATLQDPVVEPPGTAQSTLSSEPPRDKTTRDRQPRSTTLVARGAPASARPSRSTTIEGQDARAAGVASGADTEARAPSAPDRRDDAVAKPAPEPPREAARQKPGAAPDRELAEMREIERAQRLLADDPGRALALTRSMQIGFPDGHFREERAYLEVMALLELGRTQEMREKAGAFLRAYPTGLYSSRVRRAAATKAE